MKDSNIEWTGDTDNIFVVKGGGWWCRRCSEGCDNCYAALLNKNGMFKGNGLDYSGPAPEGLIFRTDIVDSWARQTRSRKHFVSSMTDVFGEWVDQDQVNYFLDGMTAAPRQTFQVLTKRAARMRRCVGVWLKERSLDRVPSNIWLGVSVENQQWADVRVPELLGIPATVRFLSCEPLLGPVNLVSRSQQRGAHFKTITGTEWLGPDEPKIHWVICGGESGPNARPVHPGWIRSLRDQCNAAGVAFFFKQWGEWWYPSDRSARIPDAKVHTFDDGTPDFQMVFRVGKKFAGRELDGRTWDEFPKTEVPA